MKIGSASGPQDPATSPHAVRAPVAKSSIQGLIRGFPAELYPVVLSLGLAIAFFALMDGLYYATYAGALAPFDLNGEITHGFYVPAIFSAGLLFAACSVSLREARVGVVGRWAWLGIGAFFAFMGVDELATLHEHLQSWTGTDWQLLYVPVVAIGAVCWLAIFGAFSVEPVARLMWVGGMVAWFLAQVIEHFEFNAHGLAVGFGPELILIEEIGEMIGSTCFLLAILVFAHRATAQR